MRGPGGHGGREQRCGAEEGEGGGGAGALAAIKGPGAAERRIPLARSHSGRSSTSIAAGQHQMGMETALAARLGLGLLLLALLLPTQVSPGAARRLPSAGPTGDAGERPRRAPPRASPPRRPPRERRGAGFCREELPLVCAIPEPAAAPRGRPWVAGGSSAPGRRRRRRARGTSPGSRGGHGRGRAAGRARSPGMAVAVPWIIPVKSKKMKLEFVAFFFPLGILEGKSRNCGVSGS